MKLSIPCMACQNELNHPTFEFSHLEFLDDGRYEICCSRGHNAVVVLQNQKFEILFEIGTNAILDGYYREAVSSFTSSLERFYEYCIKILCKKRMISAEIFLKAWKQVGNQSERQLGAFLFLWLSEFSEIPTLLSSDDTSFRNSIIHKGKIPTKAESLVYGNNILALIHPKIEKLKLSCKKEMIDMMLDYICENSKLNKGQVAGGTMHIASSFNIWSEEKQYKNQTLEDALVRVSTWRKMLHTQALS